MTKVRTPEAPTQNLGVISAQPNPVTKVRTSLRTPEGEAPTSLPASTAHTHTFKGVVFYMPDVRLWATIRFLSPPKAVEFDFFLRGSTHTPPKPRTLEAHAHDSGARSTNCLAGRAPSGRQMVREVAQPDSDYEGDCPAMVQPSNLSQETWEAVPEEVWMIILEFAKVTLPQQPRPAGSAPRDFDHHDHQNDLRLWKQIRMNVQYRLICKDLQGYHGLASEGPLLPHDLEGGSLGEGYAALAF